MKCFSLLAAALAAWSLVIGNSARADDMASVAIDPATGVVTLTARWTIGANLAGFHYMEQDLSLGGGPTQFYSLKSTPILAGGDPTAFTVYNKATGFATPHVDIGSKLTPNSYSSLTSADPNLGYGAVQFYFIHHRDDGDYFAHLVPGSGTSSAVTDLKPMSQPAGRSGYLGLTFAASDLGYGANLFYYLHTDAITGFATFGSLVPALAGASTDRANLGIAGYNALAYTPTDVGYGMDQLYYLRLDPVTGFTILGRLDASNGRSYDIANLGSVFTTLTFVVTDVSFGPNKFYTTGAMNLSWQSVSFPFIADRAMNDGAFTVAPSASSGLPVSLTVVPGSTGAVTISGPVAGVFTVTPIRPGRVVLQATQAGQAIPTAYEFNMLRQGFSVGPGNTVGPYVPPGVVAPVPGGVDIPLVTIAPLLCDFNRDGNTDILWRNSTTGELSIWLMNGTRVLANRTVARSLPPGKQPAAAGDFNGDGATDILWRDAATGKLSLWLMRGTRVRSNVVIATHTPKSKTIVASGDFNRDGKTDLVWRKSSGTVGVWLMNGKKRLVNRSIGSNARGLQVAGAGDFSADGNADILWRHPATGSVTLWRMNGTTFTSSSVIANTGRKWSLDATGDFNRDGQLDILLRNPASGATRVWLINGSAIRSSDLITKRPRFWEISN